MPRLILSLDGVVLKEIRLTKDRTTVGRRSHNDVVIDNLAVSGEHAVIYARDADTYLEDLGSTNGTAVNGQPIKRHLLRAGDLIEIGKYRLKYLPADDTSDDDAIEVDGNQPLRREFYGPGPATIQVRHPGQPLDTGRGAYVRIMNGVNEGREMPVKALTTIGRPGHYVAVITRRPTGYFIAHLEGDLYPAVNGHNIGSAAHPLKHGDVIELAGVKMEFDNPPAAGTGR